MVTSALAGEGKSFTSINLALSIAAELDNTVMCNPKEAEPSTFTRRTAVPDCTTLEGLTFVAMCVVEVDFRLTVQ